MRALPRSSSSFSVGGTLFLLAFGLAQAASGCGAATGAKAGTQCFSTIECAAGLVCIAQGSSRVCSSNIAGLETMEDAGMDAQPPRDSSIPIGIFPTDGPAALPDVTSAPDVSTTLDAPGPVEDAPASHTSG